MPEAIMVRASEDGLDLVGDWPTETTLEPQVLGQALACCVRTTVKFQLGDKWALYRVSGFSMSGHLVARRIRRGRGKASS